MADLYTPADIAELDEDRDLGRPGEYPFTRGVQATMYRGRFWTMRQYAGFSTAADTNQRFRYLLEQGQTGPVGGLRPAHADGLRLGRRPCGRRGRPGRGADLSLEDMEVLLDGLPLGEVSTSMTINATAAILLGFYVAVADSAASRARACSGTVQNDILKEYIARGTYIYPTGPSMRLVTDIFAFCAKELPRWNTISISGYHMREAGATAAQELAFTLADAIAYVEGARARGLDVDRFAGRLSFFFASWSELFEEVAKFRAARRMWARIMRERFGATNPRSMMCRFHVQTAGSSSLTAQSIDNNVVRTTLQALAAVLGGTQSLHTNSRDEALALPTEESARLALRTQQIIAYEAGVTETPDPLAGSYYVESLTDDLEAAAHGLPRSRSTRWAAPSPPSTPASSSARSRMRRTGSSGRSRAASKVVVGVNRFQDGQSASPPLQRIDPAAERAQAARVRQRAREP